MRKRKGFPVESIGRAIMDCRPVRALVAKTRDYLAGMGAGRLKTICMVMIAGMLIGDVVLLLRAGRSSRVLPDVSAIRSVVIAGAERRQGAVRPFGQAWDSLASDPSIKKQWDSLLLVRPGFRDTLQQMDSVIHQR